MTDRIDIGCGHSFAFVEYKGDEHAAIDEYHLTKDGKECKGFIPLKGGSWVNEFGKDLGAWDVISLDPLTLSPSLLCRVCGSHGFIRDGKWVEA